MFVCHPTNIYNSFETEIAVCSIENALCWFFQFFWINPHAIGILFNSFRLKTSFVGNFPKKFNLIQDLEIGDFKRYSEAFFLLKSIGLETYGIRYIPYKRPIPFLESKDLINTFQGFLSHFLIYFKTNHIWRYKQWTT